MEFHVVGTLALTAGAYNSPCTPSNLAPRAGSEADGFTYWRLKSLRFRFIPNATTALLASMGVVAGQPNTLPTTSTQVSELIDSTPHGLATVQLNWSDWVNVRKEVCAGAVPWYNTFPGTFNAGLDYPCTLVVGGNGTDSFVYELRFTLQFKDPAATANTPAAILLRDRSRIERELAQREEEKKKLLQILSLVPATSSLSKSDQPKC